MDIFILKALVDDLRHRLQGAVVSKVFQMNADDLLVRLWRRQNFRLLLSTASPWPCLHLTTERFQNPSSPLRFAAFLRAHLQHLCLLDLQVRPDDRVLSMLWAPPGASHPTVTLVQEFQGTQANLLLVNAEGIIMETLKPVPTTTRRVPVLPGYPYQPAPLPPGRLPLSALTGAHLASLRQHGHLDVPHLRRLVVGLPASLAAELVHRSQDDIAHGEEMLHTLHQQYAAGTLALLLHTAPNGSRCLSPVPLTYKAGINTPFVSAHEAVVTLYQPQAAATRLEQRRYVMQRTVTQRLQKLRKKIANLHQDAHRLQGYLPYQHYGTLLVTQRVPRSATSVTVVDYYNPEQASIEIPLDARLSGYDNAQAYFKKYRKARNGLGTLQTFLTQYIEEEQRLERLLQQAAQATQWHELDTIAGVVEGAPLRPRRHTSPGASAPVRTAVPYRTFELPQGYILYCGKSDQGNEALLRQVATAEDIWLHAAQQAGAHVLLKSQTMHDVPEQILRTAAAVAAFYSKGKHAASVEVLYTRAKHVRKVRGSRPGQVQVRESRTISVAPQLPGTNV